MRYARSGVVVWLLVACAPQPKPVPSTMRDGASASVPDASPALSIGLPQTTAKPDESGMEASAQMDVAAGRPASSSQAAPAPSVKVKIVTIGMHVAGGPFDEP